MKQKFLLEKSDFDLLKSGKSIFLNFAGGHIELSADAGSAPKKVTDERREEIEKMRRTIVGYMAKIKRPLRVPEISTATGIVNKEVHNILIRLATNKITVNSTNGWRLVHPTSAITNNSAREHANAN